MAEKKKKGSKKARLTAARLAAVQCVYQWLQAGSDSADILDYYDDHFTGLQVEDEEMLPPDRDLLSQLLKGVQKNFKTLEATVESHISKKPENRDSKKDLIILSCLYCGSFELIQHQEYDAPLIISEYLHIARSFYDDTEVKLVNGVLDAVKKTLNR